MSHRMKKQAIQIQGQKVMTYHCGEGDETLLLISGGPGCPSDCFHDTHDRYADLGLKPECAMLSRDYLPNATLKIMKNCSHTTFVENPEEYHQILSTFLKQHARSFKAEKLAETC